MPRHPRLRLSCAPLLCLVIFATALMGCQASYQRVAQYDAASPAAIERAPALPAAPAAPGSIKPAAHRDAPVPAPGIERTPVPAAGKQASVPPAHSRQIIYTGSMTLTTPDAEDAMLRIQREAEALGGFLGKWESGVITIRVPVGNLREAIARIEKLGSITDKKLAALDVTDQVRDLEARIRNAEAIRQRLVALVERSGKMEELLKVEQELARVTEEKERLEAQVLALREGAAFSTLAIRVIEAQPQRKPTYSVNLPFAWINHIGTDLRAGGGDFGAAQRKLGRGVTVDLPDGFVRFRQDEYRTIAMSASQVMIKVSRHDNYDKADAAFWTRLVERHFRKSGLIDVVGQDVLPVRDNKSAVVLRGTRAFGQGDFNYLIATAVSDDHVYTYEAWGPAEDFALTLGQIEASIKTMKASSGW